MIVGVLDSESSGFEFYENEILFMAIQNTCEESNTDDDVELVEVDLEL